MCVDVPSFLTKNETKCEEFHDKKNVNTQHLRRV